MNPESWQKVKEIFEAALARPTTERAAFLDQACDGNKSLRQEVESLLHSHQGAGSFMETPAVQSAAKSFAGDEHRLRAAQRISHYEIVGPIGEGGMGEVYLAQDTSLRRLVALKILSGDIGSHKDRMRRFVQEAQAAAALNHPNIAHIYEIGQRDGVNFIAMEFIDGLTLRELIHSGKTDLAKLLRYLQQVAEGLAKAHAAGIVHRDLKPDNIMITREGQAKILDFGLAKLIEQRRASTPAEGSSEVATAVMPQRSTPGTVMGTVGYMSPEQAQGKTNEIDQRSDIFSFGCILFEVVTGQKPFEGESVIKSLHMVVYEPAPPIADLNPSAPPELQRIVRRCLAKDPEGRYQSIKELAIELKEVRHEMAGVEIDTTGPSSTNPSNRQRAEQSANQPSDKVLREATARWTSSAEYTVSALKRHKKGVAIAAIAFAMVLATAGYFIYARRAPALTDKDRFFGQHQTRSGPGERFQKVAVTKLAFNSNTQSAAISPDGKYVVYTMYEAGKESIWVRQVTIDSNIRIVPPSEEFHWGLIFSPDSNYVYYAVFAANEQTDLKGALYQVPTLGGTAKRVIGDVYSRVAFSPDGKRLAFVRRDAAQKEDVLLIANADGTGEQKLASRKYPDNISPGSAPAWSPDGGVIAYAVGSSDANGPHVNVIEVRIADRAVQIISPHRWQWVKQMAWLSDASGLIITAREPEESFAHMWYLSYPGGEARRITNDLSNYYIVSLTADSSALVTVQNQLLSNLWIAPKGELNHATQITNGSGRYFSLSWLPDGKILYESDASGSADIWEMEADGTGRKQLTAGAQRNYAPAASLDGHYIVFQSDRTGTWQIWRTDRDGYNPKQLTDGNEGSTQPQFSPDGKWVVYRHGNGIWKVSNNGGAPAQLTDQPSMQPTISPDGKWIAYWYYQEQENPLWRLAIMPSEGGQPIKIFDLPPTVQAEMKGGDLWKSDVRWTADGHALTYIATGDGIANIWSHRVDGGKPVQLTDFKDHQIFSFDWSRDGKLLCSRGTEINDVVLIRDSR